MRGLWKASLAPRTVDARASSSCSSTNLDVRITYGAVPGDPATPIQRRIEQRLALPGPAWRISIAGVELGFADGTRLSDVSVYGNFAALASTDIAMPAERLSAAWLGFAGLDLAADDVFTVDGALHLAVDRPHGVVSVRLAAATEWFRLADGLLIGIDGAGQIAWFLFERVCWTE